jgi:hypothetical protein
MVASSYNHSRADTTRLRLRRRHPASFLTKRRYPELVVFAMKIFLCNASLAILMVWTVWEAQAQTPAPPPPAAPNGLPGQPAFEVPGPVHAAAFLPRSAFAGRILFVEKVAQNNGLQNTYRIRSHLEEYEVTGTEAALQLLQELRVIDQLRRISSTQAFTRGLTQSAQQKYESAKEIVRDPVAAVKRVPQGAARFFGKVKDFLSQDEEDAGAQASTGEAMKGILGVEKAKRELALRLGVDVYSRNQVLQEELDRVASAMAGGGLALNVGTMPIGGPVGMSLTVVGVDQTVQSLINNSSADDLRKWNEQKLSALGADRDLTRQFLNHPWYSPRQETIITAALENVQVNPDLFLETANRALTDQDASYFQHVAQLLSLCSRRAAPIKSFRVEEELLCAVDSNGVLLVPVSFDYGIWTETVAQRVDALAGLVGSDQGIKGIEIWTDGQISERAKEELGKRSIGYECVSLLKMG